MRAIVSVIALLAAGTVQANAGAFPEFAEPNLKQGRAVWLGNCQVCHANPLGDAPQVKDKAAWAPRIGKGREALYRSAVAGSVDGDMPARGGNATLSDADVRAAVDYMIKLVTQ
jgi:cytochrome c5